MNKSIQKSENCCKILSKWWFLIILFIFVVYVGGKQTYVNYILKHNGYCIKARVYDRKNGHRGKGDVITRYHFEWKNETYSGISMLDDKYHQTNKFFLTENDLIIGDTIVVVFLESNPKINRSNSQVKKDCDCE